jgi:serine/threonine-protein kinase HipA
MDTINNIKKLTVRYNGRVVGYLAELDDGEIGFQYDSQWLKEGFSISPFSLPLQNKIFVNSKDTFGGLYGVFSDSLPDGWGELLLDRMLTKRGINPERLSPLTRLTLISGQGLGALTYDPCQIEFGSSTNINFDQLSADIQRILNDRTDEMGLDDIYNLGGSSGGARPKAHVKINGEDWIVKFPCRYDPDNIGEQEYKANMLAVKCGLNVNECTLFPSQMCSGYYGAKRFDRSPSGKMHMISLSSLLETSYRIPNLDYIHLMQVVQTICVKKDDLYEAFGRMCFNVLYGNKDDHGKNFAFLYDEELKGYKLSPFYDITKTPKKAEHEMTVNGSGNPTPDDIMQVAKVVKLSATRCKQILKRLTDIISSDK